MIQITLPSKRKKHKSHITPLWPYTTPSNVGATKTDPPFTPTVLSGTSGGLWEQAMERDKLIRNMYAATPYRENDWVTPVDAANHEKYGDRLQVMKIMQNYSQFPKQEKWPENNRPYTIHAYSPKLQSTIQATPGFFKLADPK